MSMRQVGALTFAGRFGVASGSLPGAAEAPLVSPGAVVRVDTAHSEANNVTQSSSAPRPRRPNAPCGTNSASATQPLRGTCAF
jgi:hypothetical protein